jgi:hypothetical protein
LLPRRPNAHELPPVCATQGKAVHNFIPLGNQ